MIKRCLNLYALLTHGYPSCLPQQTPDVVAARLAGSWRVMSGKRELWHAIVRSEYLSFGSSPL
jgi:hypothetical protein